MRKLQIPEQFQKWLKNFNFKECAKKQYLFLIIVVLPVFVLIFYYVLIASDKYLSEAKISVKETGQQQTSFNIGFLSVGNPTAREDAMYLKEYILSYDMLDYLDKRLNLKKLFQDKSIDFISRLVSDATHEEFLEYYQDHVDVLYDEISSVLTVRVYAYKAEDAKNINDAILEQCERYMNDVSHKIARDQMNFIEDEVLYTGKKMQIAKNRVVQFQNTYKILDPTSQAEAASTLVAQLEQQLASQEAQLKSLLSYMNENSLQVQALKTQINALKQQIESEKTKVTGGGNSKLNKILAQYMDLKLESDFSMDLYKSTLAALEKTRVDASRKLKNLVVIASPNLPDEALYPKKTYNTVLVTILLLIVYGIIRVLLGIIKEHKL